MKIGGIILESDFTLAPLAGYGDIAFRRLCRDFGAALTVTEMVSAKGLVYANGKTESLLRLAPNETPSCVQLFGSDPDYFAKALRLPVLDKFDIIDINMGCPVPKVTKCGEGGALMLDIPRAQAIVRACKKSSGGRPVTVKHRIGYRAGDNFAAEFGAAMQEAGATALTVHGRTVAQGYSGTANWDAIAEVAKAVTIPVIGNGDITDRAGAERAMKEYGTVGVAVGRGALGHPDIFSDKKAELLPTVLKHIEYALEYFSERTAVTSLRKHLCKYLGGKQAYKELKAAVNEVNDAATLRKLIIEGLS